MDWFETPAVVLSGPRAARVRQVRCRPPLTGEVRIRTLFSGVSTGTDKWVMQGRFVWGGPAFPFVPGYQRCGLVTAVGPDTEGFQVGQQVVATTAAGLEGVLAASGGHLADAVSPVSEVFDATGIDPRAASLFVCGQVGLNAASRLTIPAQARVVIVGDGIIGASAALSARMLGYDVMIVGRHARRLDTIARDGIVAVNTRDDARAAVADFQPTGAIDTVQSDESFSYFVEAIPRGTGEVVFSGHSPDGITHWADMAELQKREHTAHFVSGWKPERVSRTLAALRSGDLPLGGLVGVAAAGRGGIERTITEVVEARLGPVAAVLDWSDPQ
jgi:bacteriochlorophyllide a dehydrogenase